ncbi:MAG: YneF family protein [Spiroplasmataceae bacterium]|nr:YneF family protein [Spiroplasmataceae bacterium]
MDSPVIYLAIILVSLLVGTFIGIFISRYLYKKQIKEWEKKMGNPDKEQVRNMLSALGQKPSEEQINRFINMTKKQDKKSAKVSKISKKKNKKV